MEIVYNVDGLKEYVGKAALVSGKHPILIDAFLENAYEFDVDAICDGEEVCIAGIMQHIEEAGIHSGDSSCVYPPYYLTNSQQLKIELYTKQLALELKTIGLINIQFAMKNNIIYVLEVNPRASRTIPFISKIKDIPGTIVHGRYDMICKTEAAESLHRAWPSSQLQIIPDTGHSTSEPSIAYALCRATRDMSRFIQESKK